MSYPPALIKRLARMAPQVRARVIRLNPVYEPGRRLRGWHPHHTRKDFAWQRDVVSKRWFIDEYGREAWDYLRKNWPNAILKHGKHAYVTREAVQDQLWKWAPDPHVGMRRKR